MEIKKLFFDWKYYLVGQDKPYFKLFNKLDNIEYKYILSMDENRLIEGIELRYIIANDLGIDTKDVMAEYDSNKCSVLDMLIALSIDCEEKIMWDPDLGNRTDKWFWEMLTNLNLQNMTDELYDDDYVEEVILKWLNRDYDYCGRGNIFYIKNPRQDLRKIDTWYQLRWYIEDIYKY